MQIVVKSSLIFVSSLVFSAQAIAEPTQIDQPPAMQVGAAPEVGENVRDRLDLSDSEVRNNVIYDLLNQIDQLKREVSELRGIAERQGHEMSLLTKRQRGLYQDVDRRMLDLEAGSPRGKTRRYSTKNQSSSGIGVNSGSSGLAISPANSGLATDGAQEQVMYTKAFNLLKEGSYTKAITAFREFLKAYGNGKYADNAQYWLGEANYATRDYKTALVEFQKIVTDYQDSPKRKDAELKIGFTYYELKDWDAAKRALTSVVSQYPETTNARTAKQRLERLTREGR